MPDEVMVQVAKCFQCYWCMNIDPQKEKTGNTNN
jgi:hypothetical protein